MKKKICTMNLDQESIHMLEVLSIETGLAKSALMRVLIKTAFQSRAKLVTLEVNHE